MFFGEYSHALDDKGRVILPARFRGRLQDGCVITIGQDRCLYVFTKAEWDGVVSRISKAAMSNEVVRRTQRLVFSQASEQAPDKQGRVFVPEQLRRYANLRREVAIIGSGPRIEIWDAEAWAGYREEAEGGYAVMAEAVPDLPF